jgi:hypothetical protein
VRYLVVAVLGLTLVLSGCTDDEPNPLANGDPNSHLVAGGSASLDDEARLDVVSGATSIEVRAADLDDQLFRAWTPNGSRVLPDTTVNDDNAVRVSLRDSGGGHGDAELHIELNADVQWRIRLDGGATQQSIELGAGRLSALEFGAGSARIDATLPLPRGTVPIRMTGGASVFDVHLPAGTPAQVLLAGGAGQAIIDGTTRNGLPGSTTLTTGDWTGATDRYDLNLVAGVSALTLDRVET